MEKKDYLKPELEVLSLETECEILTTSGNPGEEVDEGDNAARPNSSDQDRPSFTGVFDD